MSTNAIEVLGLTPRAALTFSLVVAPSARRTRYRRSPATVNRKSFSVSIDREL
jgi:hypothetical protein